MKLIVRGVAEERLVDYLYQVVIPDLENGMSSGYTGPESWALEDE